MAQKTNVSMLLVKIWDIQRLTHQLHTLSKQQYKYCNVVVALLHAKFRRTCHVQDLVIDWSTTPNGAKSMKSLKSFRGDSGRSDKQIPGLVYWPLQFSPFVLGAHSYTVTHIVLFRQAFNVLGSGTWCLVARSEIVRWESGAVVGWRCGFASLYGVSQEIYRL